jgi:hypothetical protein
MSGKIQREVQAVLTLAGKRWMTVREIDAARRRVMMVSFSDSSVSASCMCLLKHGELERRVRKGTGKMEYEYRRIRGKDVASSAVDAVGRDG